MRSRREPKLTWAQASASEKTSRAIHLFTQRMPSKGAIEFVPDRLDPWYATDRDAAAGVTIAEETFKQAGGFLSSFKKTAAGAKKRMPSVSELPAAGGNKLWMIERLKEQG